MEEEAPDDDSVTVDESAGEDGEEGADEVFNFNTHPLVQLFQGLNMEMMRAQPGLHHACRLRRLPHSGGMSCQPFETVGRGKRIYCI